MEKHRSWHFVPAHRNEYLEKAFGLAADVLVFDLEDGVPSGEKDRARKNLENCLAGRTPVERARCYVRVNWELPVFRKDLALLRRVKFGGVVVPKVDGSRALRSRMVAIGAAMPRGGRIALIESFRAVAGLASILDAWPLSGVGLGLEDLFSEVDIPQEHAADLAKHVKLRLVVEARARGLLCLDSVSLEYRNRVRIARNCAASRALGFDGMFSIHPRQIGPMNAAFAARRADILWARKIARLTSLREGSGYSKSGEEVTSPPKVRKASRILGGGAIKRGR